MLQASKDSSALEVQDVHGPRRASKARVQEFFVAVFQDFKDSKTREAQIVHTGRDCKKAMESFQV